MKTQSPLRVLFWVINVPLLMIGYLGVLLSLGTYLTDTVAGTLPVDFLFALTGFVAVPTFCVVLAQRRQVSLLRLFYGVEAPLLLLCTIRFFWLRELTFANGLIIVAGILCAVAYLDELLNEYRRPWQWLRMAVHSLMLLVGLYGGAISLFYSIAFLVFLIREPLPLILIYLFPLVFLAFVWLIFITIPLGTAGFYFRSWQQHLSDASEYGLRKAIFSTAAVIIVGISVFIGLQHQPQNQAFALLNSPVDSSSRQALLQKSDTIRSGLLNAYLAQYRYPNTRQDNSIYDLYRSLGFSDSLAQSLQNVYSYLVALFLYNGDRVDSDRAAHLYAQFFDTPIIKAEQKAIKQTLGATFRRNEAKAGLLDINEEKVWLAQQQITVEEHGDWADVELYEVYDNQTAQQ